MNLLKSNPSTLMPSAELDALIAEEWMGWKRHDGYWYDDSGTVVYKITHWSPSINPAHASEARRKADSFRLETWRDLCNPGVWCQVEFDDHLGDADCLYSETNGDKGKAEALVMCRAIGVVMKAEAERKGEA